MSTILRRPKVDLYLGSIGITNHVDSGTGYQPKEGGTQRGESRLLLRPIPPVSYHYEWVKKFWKEPKLEFYEPKVTCSAFYEISMHRRSYKVHVDVGAKILEETEK